MCNERFIHQGTSNRGRARTIIAALTLALATPVFAAADDARPITDFGAKGDAVPTFVRDLLPEGFFSLPITEGLASGKNYVATLDLGPASVLHDDASRGAAIDALLNVTNTSTRVADIVISTSRARGAEAENFVIHLEAGAQATVDLAPLGARPTVHLASLLPFAADVFLGKDRATNGVALDVLPPASGERPIGDALSGQPASKAGSCSPNDRIVQVCNAGTSNCVTALASRFVFQPVIPGPTRSSAGIDYPIGMSFHCPDSFGIFSTSTCQGSTYRTRRCDGTPYRHRWPGLDKTINNCMPSSASCTSGCVGSWDVTC